MNDMDLIQSNQAAIMRALVLVMRNLSLGADQQRILSNRADATERQVNAKLTQQWPNTAAQQGPQ